MRESVPNSDVHKIGKLEKWRKIKYKTLFLKNKENHATNVFFDSPLRIKL